MKNTKGKQRIEMKKVEDYGERMTTFSKRKSGIIKKMNEIVAQCDVEASFLVFSQSGKPHSFAHPSMEDAYGRVKIPLMSHEPLEKEDANAEQVVEGYKRQKNEVLKKVYADWVEELEMIMEKEQNLKDFESGLESEKKWWETGGLSMEELKQRHQAFVELNVNLASQQFEKDGDGSSSSDVAVRGDPDA